jgi:predicted DNA-binding transcriptional regulator
VIKRAISEFHAYVNRKIQEVQDVEKALRGFESFNGRQLVVLSNAVRNPDARYTYVSHARSHNISHQSARNDLIGLFQRGLLERRKLGRQHYFTPISDLGDRLSALQKKRPG